MIYNGIDATRFVPGARTDKTVRVLFSGNLSMRKGAHLLPDIALHLAPNVELLYTRGLRRGGLSIYPKVKRDLGHWLAEDRTAYLTTMFDLYRLPADFPGFVEARRLADPYQKVRYIEATLAEDIADPRFIPHVQLHEFEGLLFSEVGQIDAVLHTLGAPSRIKDLAKIRAGFDSPEEINDGEDTAPSKRIVTFYPSYDKVVLGSLIAEQIGLAKMRAECRHFDAWMATLENLTPLEEAP